MCLINLSFVEKSPTVIKLKSGHDFVTDRPTNRRKGKIYMQEL